MTLIIHDLEAELFSRIFRIPDHGEVRIVENNRGINTCIGCYDCWIKTPSRCVIQDGFQDMGHLLSQAEKVVIISRCCYGGYSSFVKNVLDRSISYLLPFFVPKNGETHHRQRYENQFAFHVYFYGDSLTEDERETAKRLVSANAVNFDAPDYQVDFLETPVASGERTYAL